MRFNWSILLGGALVISALAYVLGKGFGHDPHEVPFMLTGKRAPAFSLPRLLPGETSWSLDTAAPVSLASLGPRPLVLNFWSSWCVPCKAEHPVLEWGNDKLGKDVRFVGVVYQDTLQNISDYLVKTPSKLLQLFDESGRVAVDFGLAGVPETYFITSQGFIQYKQVGPLERDELLFRLGNLLRAEQALGGAKPDAASQAASAPAKSEGKPR